MILTGDALTVLKSLDRASVRCIVTSPPYYGLRDYGHKGQIGLEASPDEYVARLVEVFREARRVLTKDGTLWLNLGDSYFGSGKGGATNPAWAGNLQKGNAGSCRGAINIKPQGRPKNLIGIPWRTAFALQADGWNLRQEIIWAKPAPMPESVKDRFTRSHESIFLFSKSRKYYFDADAVKEKAVSDITIQCSRENNKKNHTARQKPHAGTLDTNGDGWRNKRDVWTIPPEPYRGAHFATFPAELARTCIKAGSARGDTVLDMFSGSGTVGVACILEGREYIGIELNPDYVKLQEERLAATERTGFLF